MEENQLLNNSNENELKINELMKGYLTTTYKWTKFFAILSFVSVGIIALAGIFMLFVANYSPIPFGKLLGVFYLILAGVFIPIAIYLS